MAASTDSQLGIRSEVAALKRARTVSAAVDLFYQMGYEHTTLDMVAERLGVTKPFIYAHFTSKGELLAEICARGIGTSLDALNSVLSTKATPAEKLLLLSERFPTAVLESQKHVAIFMREEKNLAPADLLRINDMRRTFDRRLAKLLGEGIDAGEFEESDAHITALAIGGMVSWAWVWYRAKGRLSIEEIAGEISRLIMRMVRK